MSFFLNCLTPPQSQPDHLSDHQYPRRHCFNPANLFCTQRKSSITMTPKTKKKNNFHVDGFSSHKIPNTLISNLCHALCSGDPASDLDLNN